MATETSGAASLPLPLFMDDRPRGGHSSQRSPQRATFTEPEPTPQRPPDAVKSKSSRESAQGRPGDIGGPVILPEEVDERDRTSRWEPPEDWRSQWEPQRSSREWYPAYQGPERYEYIPAPKASGVYRSSSLRSQRPPVVYRQVRYSKSTYDRPTFEREPPQREPSERPVRVSQKYDVDDRYDSEEELVTYSPKRAGGGGGRKGPPQGPHPSDTEPPLRLPWMGWLNITVKSRA